MSYRIFPNLGELIQGDFVSNISKGLASKDFSNRECNCNSTTKLNGMCAYRGECCRCFVVYKVTCKCCGDLYVVNTQNYQKRMEQHFQDVAQKSMNDKNSDSFADHFAKHFTQKPSPQQCREIMSFEIIYTVNHVGSMKTWGKSSCTICMKERIEIIDNSQRRYSRLINACSEVYGAYRHIPIFHRFTQH